MSRVLDCYASRICDLGCQPIGQLDQVLGVLIANHYQGWRGNLAQPARSRRLQRFLDAGEICEREVLAMKLARAITISGIDLGRIPRRTVEPVFRLYFARAIYVALAERLSAARSNI